MSQLSIAMPKDPNSEIYYDPNRLVIDFRKRSAKKPGTDLAPKVLRVVVQCFGWVIEDRFFPAGSLVTVGAGKKNSLRIPTRDLPEEHPLIEYTQQGTVRLTVNSHFDGVLQMEDRLVSLAEATPKQGGGLRVVEIGRGARGYLQHGTVILYFEEISDPEKVPPLLIWKNLTDPYFFRWMLISLVFHLLLLLILWLMPAKPTEITLEELKPQFQKIIIQPSKIQAYVPKLATQISGLSRGKQGQEGEGERAPGPEGRRGRGVPGAGRRMASTDVNKMGILDVFNKGGHRSAFSELTGGSAVPGSVDSAFNRAARYGLQGERDLREGKGLQGSGTGGGGLSTSIGQGLGTKGRGGGAKGPGLADFGTGRSDTAVSASIDEEEVYIRGNIPKDVIARIINNYIGQIRYCYERQLVSQPDLKGKIVTDFTIGLEGSVTTASVKRSTMGSPPVEQCVLNVLRRIEFPKPGGGVVQVIYPFLFRVAG